MLYLVRSFLAASLLIAGCASQTPAPVTVDNPAIPDAPPGKITFPRATLRADALTLETRKLLSAAVRDQKEWNKHGPASGAPEERNAPATTNAMQGMSAEEMKGMK